MHGAGKEGEKRVLMRGPGRSVGGGAGSLVCGPMERRGVTGDAGDAGDALTCRPRRGWRVGP